MQYLIPWIKANLARGSKWCSLDVAPEVKPMTWERRRGQIHLFGLLSIKNYNLMKCENTQAGIQRIMVKYYGFFLWRCGLNMSRYGGVASCHTLLSSWLAHRHGHHAPYPQVRPSLVVNDNRKWEHTLNNAEKQNESPAQSAYVSAGFLKFPFLR